MALPHIPRALGFSGSGLSWVVNAYAVTFGGLMLLGGRRPCRSGRRGSGWPGRSCTPRRTVATPGGEDGFRVWFIINEITDGNWASAGQIFRLPDILAVAISRSTRLSVTSRSRSASSVTADYGEFGSRRRRCEGDSTAAAPCVVTFKSRIS